MMLSTYTLPISTPEVHFAFSNHLTRFCPPGMHICPSLRAQCIQRRPILRMVILEIECSPEWLKQLLFGNKLRHILIELEFGARMRVDEGRNELEKRGDIPRHCVTISSGSSHLLVENLQSVTKALPNRSG